MGRRGQSPMTVSGEGKDAAPGPGRRGSGGLNMTSSLALGKSKRTGDERGGRDDSDNGFGQWGGYMTAKKLKLDEQFHTTKGKTRLSKMSTEPISDAPKQIFNDVSIHINGFTYPPEPELRELFIKHGGEYSQYATSSLTFIIATNLATAKKKLYAAKTLKPEWIVDSIKKGKKLDHREYFLYNLNKENKQQTLTQIVPPQPVPASAPVLKLKRLCITLERINMNDLKMTHSQLAGTSKSTEESSQESTTSNHEKAPAESLDLERVTETEIAEMEISPHDELQPCKSKTDATQLDSISNSNTIVDQTDSADNARVSSSVAPSSPPTGKMKTAAQKGFLQDFYNNSRLHLISTLKKERQLNVSEWRKKISTHKFPLFDKYKQLLSTKPCQYETIGANAGSPDEKVLFHIDLDCFFVAVARLSRPELTNKPVVVTHSKGIESKSDIACASYEARDKGISAGMWLIKAKELCPEIIAVPYDFDEYSRVSKLFYETTARLTLEMEAISCDEMLLNVTKLLSSVNSRAAIPYSLDLARFLITELQTATGISASIGIGKTRLAAKLATRMAKDRKIGCHFMQLPDVREYIREQSVQKLPGVGWSIAEKLETQLNVRTGFDLEKKTLDELKQHFGEKTGQKLYSICRGEDSDVIKTDVAHAKSISAGCSFGVRFGNSKECENFLKEISEEAASRAGAAKCYCNKMTLTLWIARKGYEKNTVKPGGHGIADVHSKSMSFKQKTRDSQIISNTALELARGIMKSTVPPEHIRGVSISMDGLTYEDEMSEKERRSVQTSLIGQIIKHKRPSLNSPNLFAVSPRPQSIQSSISVVNSKSLNPYADIQQLDPEYLAALPDGVRAEVELEFQKAKNLNNTSNSSATATTAGSSSKAMSSTTRALINRKAPRPRKKSKSPLKPNSKKMSPNLKARLENNGLFRYYSRIQSVAKAKQQSPTLIMSSMSARPRLRTTENRKNLVSQFEKIKKTPESKTDFTTEKFNDAGQGSSQQSSERSQGSSVSTQSTVELNRLTPQSSSNEILLASSASDVEPEIEQDLQILLQTTPQKKSCHEVEQMILSFSNEKTSVTSDSCSRSPSQGTSKSSTADGQQLLKKSSKKKSIQADVNSTASAGSCHKSSNSNNQNQKDTSAEELELQKALLKSYNHTNGIVEDNDSNSNYGSDNMSTANNINSDRDEDLDDLDTNGFVELELPPLNGETEIDKVHEMIRRGILNRLPDENDIECLTTYFHELAATFLNQTCNSLRFLQALQVELSKKDALGSKEWIEVFANIITDTQKSMQEDFGGLFVI